MTANVHAESRYGSQWTALSMTLVQESNEVNFTGLIESLPPNPTYLGTWGIAGRSVLVTNPNAIQGTPKLYRRATVKATPNAGGILFASQIIIDDTDSQAETFKVKAKLNSIPPHGYGEWTVGCVKLDVPLNGPLVPDLTFFNKLVEVSGIRSLGSNGVLTGTKAVNLGSTSNPNNIEYTGYLDDRSDDGTTVHLYSANIVIDAVSTLVNLDQATKGSVVTITGSCTSSDPPRIFANQITLVSKPYLRFEGPITRVNRLTSDSQPTSYEIQPVDRQDSLIILASVAPTGRFPAEVGNCMSGFGFQLADGSIDAKSIEVDRCTNPPAFFPGAPEPTRTSGNEGSDTPPTRPKGDDRAAPALRPPSQAPAPVPSQGQSSVGGR